MSQHISVRQVVQRARELARDVAARGRAATKPSVFGLSCTAHCSNPAVYFSTARDTADTVGCSAICRDARYGRPIAKAIDGITDYLLLDVEAKIEGWAQVVSAVIGGVHRSALLTYHPNELTAHATDALIAQYGVRSDGHPAAIIGVGHVGSRIAQRLVERGYQVRLWRRNQKALEEICQGLNAMRGVETRGHAVVVSDMKAACLDARVVIGCTPGVAVITAQMLHDLADGALVIDVGNGTLTSEAIQFCHTHGIRVLCVDIRAAYEGEIATLLRTAQQVQVRTGRRQHGATMLISGGMMGQRGDVIVDNYACPTQILGIADGRGDVVAETNGTQWDEMLASVRAEIQRIGMNRQ